MQLNRERMLPERWKKKFMPVLIMGLSHLQTIERKKQFIMIS